MKYTDRLKNQEAQDTQVVERLGKRSSLQGAADLLAVESQIEDKEAELSLLRLAEENYSLTSVGEMILAINDLKAVFKVMKEEYAAEFLD